MNRSWCTLLMLLVFWMVNLSFALAQNRDSTLSSRGFVYQKQELTEEEYYGMVADGHPLVQQADLLPEMAKMDLRYARGSFDPKLITYWDNKVFKGTNYFNYFDADVKGKAWIGRYKLGFLRNVGTFVGNDVQTDLEGLVYMGYYLPVGQGLFTDQRRTQVRQMQVYQEMAVAEKVKAINKIMLKANKAYWEWYFAYQNHLRLEEAKQFAARQLNGIRVLYERGDYAPIDTLKAQVNLQKIEVELAEARVEMENARRLASTFLWSPEGQYIELGDSTFPAWSPLSDSLMRPSRLRMLLDYAESNHPELQKLEGKGEQLQLELKLSKEQIKPQLDLGIEYLWKGSEPFQRWDYDYWDRNHKLNISFMMPMFLRKERAKLQLSKAKIQSLQFEQQDVNRAIQNDIRQSYHRLITYRQNMQRQEQMAQTYQRLLKAEQRKQEIGESDIFMINTRQQQLIDAQVKLAKWESRLQKELAYLIWAAGTNAWAYSP